MGQNNIQNKEAIKKQFNRLGGALLLKEILTFISALIFSIGIIAYEILSNNELDNINLDEFTKQIMENPLLEIIPVLFGLIPVVYFVKKNIGKSYILNENKKFTVKTVLILFILLLGINCSCGLISQLMETVLNVFGFTMEKSEKILESLDAPSMFIYMGIVAPVVEEFVYRGMILRFLDKFDKGLAIVGSGVLFGLMHGNFYQIFMAIGVGIFLGYIAEEYSIKLTIILHMINNIFSFLLDKLVKYLDKYSILGDLVNFGILFIVIAVLVATIIRNFKKIKETFIMYSSEKSKYLYFFTSISIILIMAINLVEAFSMISKL